MLLHLVQVKVNVISIRVLTLAIELCSDQQLVGYWVVQLSKEKVDKCGPSQRSFQSHLLKFAA